MCMLNGVWQTDGKYWRWKHCSKRFGPEATEKALAEGRSDICFSCHSPYREPHHPRGDITGRYSNQSMVLRR